MFSGFNSRFWLLLLFCCMNGLGLHAQSWQWVATQTPSSTGNFLVNGTAVDASGNIIVTGQFDGTITLGNLTLTSAGSIDIFVAKLSSTGTWLQATRAGGTGLDLVYSLALDGAGNAVITGPFRSSTITFGALSLANASAPSSVDDIYVARVNAAGTWTQAVRAGGTGNDLPSKVVVDAAGNAVVVGFLGSPSATFGPSLTTSGAGLFVARLSAAGTWTQAVKTGSVSTDGAYAVSLASNGDAWVTGGFSSPIISFGATTLSNSNPSGATTDAFVACLNAAGSWTQAVSFGGAESEVANGIDADAGGNVTVAGTFRSPTLFFGPTGLTNAGGTSATTDIFVARRTAAGLWASAARAGGPGVEGLSALAVDGSGNVFVGGNFRSPTAGFGPFSLVNTDASGSTADIFIAGLNSSYAWTQALQAGGNSPTLNDACTSLVLTGNGGAVAGGRFNGSSATFGPFAFSHPNGSGFVGRIGGLALATTPASVTALALVPNPAHARATLVLPAFATPRSIAVLDGLGRTVRTYPVAPNAPTAALDLTGLAPGLYVVRYGTASGKLVVE